MPRKRTPKPAASEDLLPEEAEWEEGGEVPDNGDQTPEGRHPDWRDLEKYFEERDLKRKLEDEFWVGEGKPVRPAPPARRRR